MNKILPKVNKIALIAFVSGLFLWLIGFYQSFSMNEKKVETFIKENPKRFALEEKENHSNEKKHLEHFIHQAHNRSWSALYVAVFYFVGISLGVLFFLAIQHASNAGWSIILTRVMEALASFLPYGGAVLFFVLLLNGFGIVHMFHWMDPSLYDPTSPNFDPILNNKSPFLNIPFFLIRSAIYLAGWTLFLMWIKRVSKKLDLSRSLRGHNKLHDVSVGFIAFFAFSSMIMGWDWVMSLDPHWFSTLFGWYVLGTYFTTGVSALTILCIYLKKQGVLPLFNKNHGHDLGKYMFATSLLWTYLWFAQFMLYWYGNIPEEVTYFINRAEQYGNIHFWMLIPNFLFPLLGLMSSNLKRNPKILVIFGAVILVGHYIDVYHMIMPGSVGGFYGFGFSELGSILLMGGAFLFITFRSLSKTELEPKGSPLFEESKHYEYPF